MTLGLIFLSLVIIGLGFYLYKFGLAKKHTGFAYVQSLTHDIQAVQRNGTVYVQIPIKINNTHTSIEVPQSDMTKYHYGKKIHVEYRTNKDNKITLVKEITQPKPTPFIINQSAIKKDANDQKGSSQFWD